MSRPELWSLPRVSRETLEFLGQWLENESRSQDVAVTFATIGRLRDEYRDGIVPGFCLHDELEWFTKAGLSTFEACPSGTSLKDRIVPFEFRYLAAIWKARASQR